MIDPVPLLLSFKLAALVTAILLLAAVPLACFMAASRSRAIPLLEALLTLPMVLPPTVLGFYLLLLFSRHSPVGRFFGQTLGIELVFSFTGVVLACCVCSFPFVLRPLKAGFESVPASLVEASYTLGKSRFETLVRVVLPSMRPALVTAAVMGFAHTLGEFGTVLMVGGSIPGVTRVASIAVYDKVEQLDYASAHLYALLLLLASFMVLLIVGYAGARRGTQRPVRERTCPAAEPPARATEVS